MQIKFDILKQPLRLLEKKDVISDEWCEIIFLGRNKRYGAYELRKSSSQRHGYSLILVLVASFIFFLPGIIERAANETIKEESQEEIIKVTEVNMKTPPEDKKKIEREKVAAYYEKVELIQPPMMQLVAVTISKESGKKNNKEDMPDNSPKDISEERFNAALSDSKGTNAQDLYDDVERLNRELAEGRSRYEIGMDELNNAGKGGGGGKAGSGKAGGAGSGSSNADGQSSQTPNKVKGKVLVRFDLPGRDKVYLHIPAYQCQYGGVAVIAISVDRSGKVVSVSVDNSSKNSNDCIERMALQSARASRFTQSNTASDPQKGTITYTFESQ